MLDNLDRLSDLDREQENNVVLIESLFNVT